ncbi:UNKNOWN [Stylonychia lemnae]|uniref:Uncharacterized protein n=1 Tax=Stylonychia lemnae TaxID=5949 RepID=A0A078AYG0_STYLE|nr:UNKNOWN [Stylonychia lemnae]|eukprot:CDW87171.1 UNKNOWN [Stylonychia lemnae]
MSTAFNNNLSSNVYHRQMTRDKSMKSRYSDDSKSDRGSEFSLSIGADQRKICWQIIIFTIAALINFMSSFRDYFIQDILREEPDSPLTMASNLAKGIGYFIIGNMYDNVAVPKKLTFILLLILGIFTLTVIQSAFTLFSMELQIQYLKSTDVPINTLDNVTPVNGSTDSDSDGDLDSPEQYSFSDSQNVIFQMSSVRVFESGSYRGFIVGVWSASYVITPIIHANFFQNTQSNYAIECYALGGCYIIMAIICKIYFYHNPCHIGVIVEPNQRLTGFFLDETSTSKFQSSDITAQIKSFQQKHRVSLIDAYQYQVYLTLVFLSCLQIVYILFGFYLDNWIDQDDTVNIIVAILVGAILGSSNFLYTCLIPLKIVSFYMAQFSFKAREITDKEQKKQYMQQNYSLLDLKASYVGTIIGTILGTTSLISTIAFVNMTSIVDFVVQTEASSVITLILLLVISNLILYKSIKKELMQFKCIRKRFPKTIKSRNIVPTED